VLITRRNFDSFLKSLAKEQVASFDSETTCLNWWRSPWHNIAPPRIFAAQFSTEKENFYLDFEHSDDKLGDEHFAAIQRELLDNPERLWFIANAKFDMHHGANHGLNFKGTVHCTKAIARVVNNVEESLSLDALGKYYLGVEKIDVMTYLNEHKLYTEVKKFGQNDKLEKIYHFDKLPLAMSIDYGEKDTRLCFDLGVFQVKKIKEIDAEIFAKQPPGSFGEVRLINVMKNEWALTKSCFDMERAGVLIDRPYTEKAYEHECAEYKLIEKELNGFAQEHLGKNLDWLSAKQLKPLFDKMGQPYKYTEKGNASFDREALESSDSEVAKLILKYRYHYKRAHTYFENFLWMMDTDSVLHADVQQGGTETGRMSYWTPNLQNIPKRRDKEEALYKVRRCFVPRKGFFFADFDYTGAEYFMMMDYAKELTIIERVKAGMDVHEATRMEMNLADRDTAKTMNFRILYGAGYAAVGRSLGAKTEAEATALGKEKKNLYYSKLPNVANFQNNVKRAAYSRGYIFNWLGRLLKYNRGTEYKSPNGLIQGGVGDMAKKAMVNISANVLPGKASRMLLQVHDALLFEIADDERELIPLIQKTMVEAYPARLLPMKTDAGFSDTAWSELQDEIPARKSVSKKRSGKAKANPENVLDQAGG
jgi:DNA polymerase I